MDARAEGFETNGVRVDFGTETIRDSAGDPVALRAQTFAVLHHLALNRGRLVTKDELMAAVWPGIAVTDDSLVQCIHEIRRALRDDNHALLKTVPRRGYRLELTSGEPPSGMPAEPAARPSSQSLLWAAVAGVFVLAIIGSLWFYGWFGRQASPSVLASGPPVIAVLPFDNLGGDPAQGYFADGMTEDLITDLSKIPGLFVIARNSVWEYRDRPANLRIVADELGVRYVLEGSVRREGGSLRVNAQLIDAVSGHHLWAERYDGTLGDVFAMQDKVIANIVSALAIELTATEQAESTGSQGINLLAYDALQQGRDFLRRDTEQDTVKAIALFEKAIELDPEYGAAYASLAAAQWRVVLSYWFLAAGVGWQKSYEGLIASLAKARERPTALAYAVSAQLLSLQGRYEEAFADVERAMALAPNDPDAHIAKATILNATGRAVEAEAEVRIAMRIDPRFAPAVLRALAISLFNQERYEEAASTLERLIARQSDVAVDYATLVSALGHLGRTEGVQALIDKYNTLALPSAYDRLTVQESALDWYGVAFDYHRPYLEKMQDGLRKAGVPDAAGSDLAYDEFARFITRHDGEFDVAGATKVTASEAKSLLERGVPFVDARAHFDYDNGHIPGATNLSLISDLSRETLSAIADPDDEVLFYCHGKYCPVSAFASAKAVAWGYRRVYYFAGGFPAWSDAGYPVEASPTQ